MSIGQAMAVSAICPGRARASAPQATTPTRWARLGIWLQSHAGRSAPPGRGRCSPRYRRPRRIPPRRAARSRRAVRGARGRRSWPPPATFPAEMIRVTGSGERADANRARRCQVCAERARRAAPAGSPSPRCRAGRTSIFQPVAIAAFASCNSTNVDPGRGRRSAPDRRRAGEHEDALLPTLAVGHARETAGQPRRALRGLLPVSRRPKARASRRAAAPARRRRDPSRRSRSARHRRSPGSRHRRP